MTKKVVDGVSWKLLIHVVECRNALPKNISCQSVNVSNQIQQSINGSSAQRDFVRVGEWLPRLPAEATGSSNDLQNHSIGSRTRTDLENEELGLDSLPARAIEQSSASVGVGRLIIPQDPGQSLTKVLEPSGNQRSGTPHDYYQFEWFGVLIGMIIITTGQIIVSIIIQLSYWLKDQSRSSVAGAEFYYMVQIQMCVFDLEMVFAYTLAFVLLTQHHQELGSFLRTYTRIPSGIQRSALRLMAYVSPCAVFAILFVKAWKGEVFALVFGIYLPKNFVLIP